MNSQEQTRLIGLGMAYQNRRQFAEAERYYQTVLQNNPDHPDGLHLMGLLAVEANRFSTAIDYFQKAIKLLPKQPMYLNNLGNGLLLHRDPAAALKHLRKAVKLAPQYVEAITNLGRAYRALGKPDDARKQFAKALTIDPSFTRAEAGLGEMLVEIGDMEGAVKSFRSILERQPHNVQVLGGLATAKRFTFEDPELGNIKKALESPSLIRDHAVILHHAAGKICNDLGLYDDAMSHYFAGKKIANLIFPLEIHSRSYAEIRRNFTKAAMANPGMFGSPSEIPVFIVGMPRSGTTLVEQIIASHPRAGGAGELSDMRRTGHQLGYGLPDVSAYSQKVKTLAASELQEITLSYLRSLKRAAPTATRVTDKNPQNFEQLGLIAKLFPNARIIHCRRNAIDTCVSNFMQSFDQSHGYNADLATLGKYYREYAQLMDHWRHTIPLKFMDLDYEEMVADQERTSRKLIEFLDLEWHDDCLRYFDNKRSVTTPSRWQVRQPIYASSVNRWKRYEKHLGPLLEALGDLAG